MEMFGFSFGRTKPDPKVENESFAPRLDDDGAAVLQAGGAYATHLDLEGSVGSEAELVTRYREMALQPEVDSAIDDIINEMVVYDANEEIVTVNCDGFDYYSARIKNRITAEFEEVLRMFDFNSSAYELARRWYVDGRMNYHVIIDEEHPEQGIQELRYIDPRKLRKVREVAAIRSSGQTNATIMKQAAEYYVYNDRGFGKAAMQTSVHNNGPVTGVRIAADSIIRVTSGLMDSKNLVVLGYLNKAIKPLNQLRTLEDASVIYRLTRAPSRRVFYVDVGSLPKAKAEQYMRDVMVKHKNKVVYDAATGEIRDDRKFMTMLEDYWMPRREGGRGTEISELPGSGSFSDMSDIEYFLNKLYDSLNVPKSRIQSEGGAFNMGRSSEITRDEIKFSKFVNRLRLRFSMLFKEALARQLVLKGVISVEEVPFFKSIVKFDFKRDNLYEELKEMEILQQRLQILSSVEEHVGKYFSRTWAKKNVLRQNEDEIEEMQAEMDEDAAADMALPDGMGDPDDDAGGDPTGPDKAVVSQRRAAKPPVQDQQ